MALTDVEARAVVLDAIARGPDARLRAIPDPTIEWVGVNRARVDAGVRGGDGSEWHVVLIVDGTRVDDVVAIRRPTEVPRGDGVAVVVNGPSGAGKSSLLGALAALAEAGGERPWVVFDEPVVGSVPMAHLVWPDASPAVHDGFLAGIAAVARAGNRVGVAAGPHPRARFAEALHGVRTVYVGVRCPLEELLRREEGREGRWGGLAERSVGAHDGWSYDLELDTTSATPDDLAREVLRLVNP